ncbi:hypothetical protein V8C86DRAFT_1621443 [Haematococcus lacustris]
MVVPMKHLGRTGAARRTKRGAVQYNMSGRVFPWPLPKPDRLQCLRAEMAALAVAASASKPLGLASLKLTNSHTHPSATGCFGHCLLALCTLQLPTPGVISSIELCGHPAACQPCAAARCTTCTPNVLSHQDIAPPSCCRAVTPRYEATVPLGPHGLPILSRGSDRLSSSAKQPGPSMPHWASPAAHPCHHRPICQLPPVAPLCQ